MTELEQVKAARDALAVQCQEMREALSKFADANLTNSNCMSFEVANKRIRVLAKRALAAPDNSSQILARHDAAIWREAADFIEDTFDVMGDEILMADALRTKADERLRNLRDELEKAQ